MFWLRHLLRMGLLLEASVLPYWPAVITSIRRMTLRGTSFPRVLLLALLEVCRGPWSPLGGRGEMAMAMEAGLHVSAVHQMLSLPSSRRVSF